MIEPRSLGRFGVWGLFAAVLAAAPLLFTGGWALTVLSQIGIGIIACLAFNILLGQGGMLSFGHAVYSGLGSFAAIHALNAASRGDLALPVSLVPLVGGLAGLGVSALLGYVTTRKAGTTFAMISLGVGELVAVTVLMFPAIFGGEGGIGANRVVGAPFLGLTYGPPSQLYGLIALYCFVCTGLMYAFTQTPLGRMLNAVRDNPERVEFVGYSTRRVRYLAFMISGFFMGIAGGLSALHFEIVTTDVVSAARSGAYLLFTFVGGTAFFFGPIIGAVLMVLALLLLSALTPAWLLYLGLAFVLMVIVAPGGIASLVVMNLRLASFGRLRGLWTAYLALAGTGLAALAGAGAMIEMAYQRQFSAALAPDLRYLGAALDTTAVDSWTGAALLLATGSGLFELVRRPFVDEWGRVQRAIEAQTRVDVQ